MNEEEIFDMLTSIEGLHVTYLEAMHRSNDPDTKTIFQSNRPDRWVAIGLCISVVFFGRLEQWLIVKPKQCALTALILDFLSVLLSLIEYCMYSALFRLSGFTLSRREKCARAISIYVMPIEEPA